MRDVEKAFDQAWRDGVIYNLMERGIGRGAAYSQSHRRLGRK